MRALDPYDAESFPDLRVESAVVFPAEFIGEAGQFLCKLKEGVNSAEENASFAAASSQVSPQWRCCKAGETV